MTEGGRPKQGRVNDADRLDLEVGTKGDSSPNKGRHGKAERKKPDARELASSRSEVKLN